MNIELQGVSKRFNFDWIFKHINITIEAEKPLAITGPNGSGKSTLLRIIAGQLSPSEGRILYMRDNLPVSREDIYKDVAVSAPYLELPEAFTLSELIAFQGSLKPYRNQLSNTDILELSGLSQHKKKQIAHFSSGMKQRLKNTLAIYSSASILILDEPTSNLDTDGVNHYSQILQSEMQGRVVLIGSNQEREYTTAQQKVVMSDYKNLTATH